MKKRSSNENMMKNDFSFFRLYIQIISSSLCEVKRERKSRFKPWNVILYFQFLILIAFALVLIVVHVAAGGWWRRQYVCTVQFNMMDRKLYDAAYSRIVHSCGKLEIRKIYINAREKNDKVMWIRHSNSICSFRLCLE